MRKATDTQIAEWADRHGIQLSPKDLRPAFEDAQTLTEESEQPAPAEAVPAEEDELVFESKLGHFATLASLPITQERVSKQVVLLEEITNMYRQARVQQAPAEAARQVDDFETWYADEVYGAEWTDREMKKGEWAWSAGFKAGQAEAARQFDDDFNESQVPHLYYQATGCTLKTAEYPLTKIFARAMYEAGQAAAIQEAQR